MGIREEKKAKLREKIILGAEQVFRRHGYEDATMQMIAKEAGVGIGTAYNYFPSKEELFLLTMANQAVDLDIPDLDKLPADQDPARLVCAMVLKQVDMFRHFSKKVWKAVLGTTFSAMSKNQKLLSRLMKADLEAMEKLRQTLELLKEKGVIKTATPAEILVDLIYGSLFLQLVMYVYMDEMTFEQAKERIQQSVLHVLAEKG